MAENEQIKEEVQDQVIPQNSSAETVSPSEKMLRQSEVNELIGRYKKEAYNRGKMDAMNELQPQQQQPVAAPMQPSPQQMGGMQQPNMDQIRQMIAEQTRELQLQAASQQIANQFHSKIDAGKSKYPDFDEKVKPLWDSLGSVPEIAMLANGVDNTADVFYDLANNLHKVGTIKSLHAMDPRLAQAEIMRLSHSIKSNQAATQTPSVNEPLSQIKPSTAGADNGNLEIDDLRRQPWMRV